MRSGMAGTGQPRVGAPTDHRTPSVSADGTAGKATGQPTRFTSVSSQRVNEGGADSRVAATEQNHISMTQGGQPRGASAPTAAEHRQGAADRRQPMSPPGQGTAAKQGPGTTRFTSRQTEKAHATETVASMTHTASKAASAAQAPSAASAPAAASARPAAVNTQAGSTTSRSDSTRPGSDRVRHSRNAPSSGGTGLSSERTPSTARQERPSAGTHSASKAASTAPRPGTAGTAARTDRVTQTRQTAQNQAAASKSTPTATGTIGGRRPSSITPARQEQRRSDDRKSGRRPRNGGVKDGK